MQNRPGIIILFILGQLFWGKNAPCFPQSKVPFKECLYLLNELLCLLWFQGSPQPEYHLPPPHYHFLLRYEIYTIKQVIRIKLSHIYDKILYLHYGNTVKKRIHTRGIQVSRETDNNSTDRPKASREELCPVGSQKRTLIEFSK